MVIGFLAGVYYSATINSSAQSALKRATDFVFGVLVSQGMSFPARSLTLRFIVGVWVLGSLVLATAYTSVLISFVTLPDYKPLVDSVYDLPLKPDIRATVTAGQAVDILFSVNSLTNIKLELSFINHVDIFKDSENGIGKFLKDMLNDRPDLKCKPSKLEDCLAQVRKGSSVYIQGELPLRCLQFT